MGRRRAGHIVENVCCLQKIVTWLLWELTMFFVLVKVAILIESEPCYVFVAVAR